jgi:large subunit ribosomal protein L23
MSFLDRFKKQHERQPERSLTSQSATPIVQPKPKAEPKPVAKSAPVKKADHSRVKKALPEAFRLVNRPVVTEKASLLGKLNKFVFEVPLSANRQEVAKAIRSIYNVTPIRVNIIRFSGKAVRYGHSTGVTKDWKKAIVTLAAGQTINVQDGI